MALHRQALSVVILPTFTAGTQLLCCLDVLTEDRAATAPKLIVFRVPFIFGHVTEMRGGSACVLFRRTPELQQYSSFWQLFLPVFTGVSTPGKCGDLSLGHFL